MLGIFKNSDMTFKDVENGPSIDEIRRDIQEVFNKFKITAFNKSFDLGFLKSRGFHFLNELPCIMKNAANIIKIPAPWNDRVEDYKWPSVEEAWQYFFPDNDYLEAHRAVDDATHEALILYEMYRKSLFPIESYS